MTSRTRPTQQEIVSYVQKLRDWDISDGDKFVLADLIESLAAQLAEAQVKLDDAYRNKEIITEWWMKADAALATAREIGRNALQAHGRHDEGCPADRHGAGDCACGLEAAYEALKSQPPAESEVMPHNSTRSSPGTHNATPPVSTSAPGASAAESEPKHE